MLRLLLVTSKGGVEGKGRGVSDGQMKAGERKANQTNDSKG